MSRVVGFAPVRREPSDVLTFEEAIIFLKVSRSALYRAVARNQVPHRRVGRLVRFSRVALLEWLGSSLTQPSAPR
ncbi:MAG: helix-turn-helix domain-containing protein [Kofleriaceae bacterium]|nr:helix-turn-helix domain-containing protein [Kofleriaceae bacterium]